MQEKRMRERVPFEVDVEVSGSGKWVPIQQSRDLSMSGILLVSEDPLPMGEEVTLRFLDQDRENAPEIRGKVVRVIEDENLWQVGVQFDALSSDASLYLYHIVQYHRM
jgi:c-di-GMP-binding flagellar brake protein YcgR